MSIKELNVEAEVCELQHVHEGVVDDVRMKMPDDEKLTDWADLTRSFRCYQSKNSLLSSEFRALCLRHGFSSGYEFTGGIASPENSEAE